MTGPRIGLIAAVALGAGVLAPEIAAAQEGPCRILCVPDLKIEPTVTFENLGTRARVEVAGAIVVVPVDPDRARALPSLLDAAETLGAAGIQLVVAARGKLPDALVRTLFPLLESRRGDLATCRVADEHGALGLVDGPLEGESSRLVASLVARYSAHRAEESVEVVLCRAGEQVRLRAVPADDAWARERLI